MTDDRMALLELVEKQADGDLVREMLAFAADRIMEAEVEARTGAAKGARSGAFAGPRVPGSAIIARCPRKPTPRARGADPFRQP